MSENVRQEWQAPADRMQEATSSLVANDVCREPICKAPIAKTRTPKYTTQPLNPEPCDDGNIVVRDGLAMSEKQAGGFRPGELRYKTHFATCVAADTFRRRRSA